MALPVPSMSMLAKDIGGGFINLNPTMLKGTQPDTLRMLNRELMKALQTARSLTVDQEDYKQIKAKNMQISRLNHAMQILKHFCRERKINLG